MLRENDVIDKRYKIMSKIDSGGMGAVYKAEDLRFMSEVKPPRFVAIKHNLRGDDEYKEAFKNEALTLVRLRHNKVPVVTDYVEDRNGQYVIMDFIAGENLGQLLYIDRRYQELEVNRVLFWANQLLDVLSFLHKKGYYHRDVKPANIVLTENDQVVLVDFGLVTRNSTYIPRGRTLRYAAPDQVSRVGPDTDLFSLAATIHDLLTGKLVPAEDRLTTLEKSDRDPLRPIYEYRKDVSKDVSDVFQRALSLDRKERWMSADQMRQALKVAQTSTITTESSDDPSQAVDADRRQKLRKTWFSTSIGGTAFLAISSIVSHFMLTFSLLLLFTGCLTILSLLMTGRQKSRSAPWLGLIQASSAAFTIILMPTTSGGSAGWWLCFMGLILVAIGGIFSGLGWLFRDKE